jgi:hypothetical protein
MCPLFDIIYEIIYEPAAALAWLTDDATPAPVAILLYTARGSPWVLALSSQRGEILPVRPVVL